MTSLFEVFSIDFVGTFSLNDRKKRHILISVEHVKNWPITVVVVTTRASEVIRFMREDIIASYGVPRLVLSDNSTCFTATSPKNLMKDYGAQWKTVLSYSPMRNGKLERMVGTLNRRISEMVVGDGGEWREKLLEVVYGY